MGNQIVTITIAYFSIRKSLKLSIAYSLLKLLNSRTFGICQEQHDNFEYG